MERIDQFSFYRLAKNLAALAGFNGPTRPSDILLPLWSAQGVVNELLKGRPIPVGVSRAALMVLESRLESLTRDHFTTTNEDGEESFQFPAENAAPIPNWQFDSWRQAVATFETVFSAEMAEATSYYIPKRGIYDTPALIDRADDSFPAEVRPFVAAKTIEDWQAAGRCLALNLCTASGFHVVRAVEGTLESYFQAFTGQPGVTKTGWNIYLTELEAIPDGSVPMPDKKTLAAIRQMKDDYRNPVVHPRVVLSEADARVLFNNGESAIIGMAQGLKEAAAGSQIALALAGKPAATPAP